MQTITRKAAKAAGLKYYFTGKPCKRGHIDKRFVCSFWCMTCCRDKSRETYRVLDTEQRRLVYANRKSYLREWVANNKERKAASDAKHRQKFKESNPSYFREHYAKNREKKKRDASEWYHANSAYALERQKTYNATRPIELRRALGRKNRAKRRAIELQVFVETVDPRVVFVRDNGMCGICQQPVDAMSAWEIDHVIPISKGGAHAYSNVQLAHRRCNRSKAAK